MVYQASDTKCKDLLWFPSQDLQGRRTEPSPTSAPNSHKHTVAQVQTPTTPIHTHTHNINKCKNFNNLLLKII